jgi:hypothetical protein
MARVTGTLATVRATPFYWRVHVFGTKGSAEVLDEVTLIVRTSGSKPDLTTYPAIKSCVPSWTRSSMRYKGHIRFR